MGNNKVEIKASSLKGDLLYSIKNASFKTLLLRNFIFSFAFFSFFLFSPTILAQITVNFTADIVQGCSPINVTFTNLSVPVEGSTFLWDFGNGNVSTARNPQTTYLTAGKYTVKLTVTNGAESEVLVREEYITVHPKPEVRFELVGDTIGCSPFNVSFQNYSIDPGASALNYTWSFGDGAKSTEQHPSHLYITKGTFDVTLLATNEFGCSSSYTEAQLAHVLKPSAQFGINESYSCTGSLNVIFTNISQGETNLASFWDFGNGSTSNLTSPSHLYTNIGTYSVKLKVTDDYGCTDEIIRNNLVQIVKTTAGFDVSHDTICPRQNVALINKSSHATSYLWKFGDQTTSTQTNLNKNYTTAGDYTIWLIAANGSCRDSVSKKINVEFVKADFLVNEQFICELPKNILYQNQSQNAVAWNWRFGNGTTSSSQNPTVNYPTNTRLVSNQAFFSDTLTVTSKHGCTDRYIKPNSVQIHIPEVKFNPGSGGNASALDVCTPASILFTDQTNYNNINDFITQRQWKYNSNPIGNGETTQISITENGKIPIELTITTSKGCINSKTEFVNAGQSFTPDFSRIGNYEVCGSNAVDFIITSPTPSQITNARWNFGDGSTDMMQMPPHDFIKTGPMNVTLTVFNYGCASSVTKNNIVKIIGPIVSFKTDIDCNKPYDRLFTARIDDATYYKWSLGDATPDIENINAPKHTYSENGQYTVKLYATNSANGCSFEFAREIFIRDIKSDFTILDGTPCLNNTLTLDGSASIDAIDYFSGNDYGKYLWNIKEENKTIFTAGPLSHKFTKKGINHISLIVQDINGCKDTLSKQITIYKPEPDFEANYKIGCMPVTFEFTDKTISESPVSKWLWNFGDGKTSAVQNPSHDYTSFGGYNISLEVTDEVGCVSKITKNQLVRAIFPDASFKADNNKLCVGQSTKFLDTSPSQIVEFYWQLSDGRTSNMEEPEFEFSQPGFYNVTLRIKDNHGCETSKTLENYVHVQNYPKADFIADVTNSNCYPLVVQFTDKSENEYPGKWKWHFGENNNLSELQNPFFIYNRPGKHDVKLITQSSYGCSDTIVKPAYIHVGGPYATIELLDTVCQHIDVLFRAENQQNIFDIRWDFGDGYFGVGAQATHQYHNPGTIYPVLFLRSDAKNTCNKAIIDTLNVLDLKALFAIKDGTDKGCVPFGPQLINQSKNSTSWIWEFGNGDSRFEKEPDYQYTNAGNYKMRLVAMHHLGCRDTSSWQNVTIFPLPTIKVNRDTVICLNTTATLTATGGESYSWIPAENLSTPNHAITEASPSETTLYQVMVTDVNQCINTKDVLVSVQQIPVVTLKDTTVIIGEFLDVDISDAGISSYVWSPPTFLNCATCPNPIIQALETTQYNVAITDTSQCFTVNYPLKLTVLKQYSVDVPSAFTPNGDGINDKIYVKGWGIKELVSFKIYNRLGREVYSSSDLNEGWDGYLNGKAQPIETYNYNVQVKTFENEILTKSGTLKLLR